MGYAMIEELLTEEDIVKLTSEYYVFVEFIDYFMLKISEVPGCPEVFEKMVSQATEDILQGKILSPPYSLDMCRKDLITEKAALNLSFLFGFFGGNYSCRKFERNR